MSEAKKRCEERTARLILEDVREGLSLVDQTRSVIDVTSIKRGESGYPVLSIRVGGSDEEWHVEARRFVEPSPRWMRYFIMVDGVPCCDSEKTVDVMVRWPEDGVMRPVMCGHFDEGDAVLHAQAIKDAHPECNVEVVNDHPPIHAHYDEQ